MFHRPPTAILDMFANVGVHLSVGRVRGQHAECHDPLDVEVAHLLPALQANDAANGARPEVLRYVNKGAVLDVTRLAGGDRQREVDGDAFSGVDEGVDDVAGTGTTRSGQRRRRAAPPALLRLLRRQRRRRATVTSTGCPQGACTGGKTGLLLRRGRSAAGATTTRPPRQRYPRGRRRTRSFDRSRNDRTVHGRRTRRLSRQGLVRVIDEPFRSTFLSSRSRRGSGRRSLQKNRPRRRGRRGTVFWRT